MRVATPLMQQYREIKARHQEAILFFRMGEFYEMFYDDAETAARVLGLTLTSRNNGGAADVPLAGVPVRAAGEYLRRLVQQGFRVAICEQMEDPRAARGVVRRAVVETITPGAAFADDLLDGARNTYVCAVHVTAGLAAAGARAGGAATAGAVGAAGVAAAGVAAADLSTGELRLILAGPADLGAVLARLAPGELLIPRGATPGSVPSPGDENALVTERDAWEFDPALARDELTRRYAVASLEGLGIGPADDAAVGAAGALLRYLGELQPGGLPHLARPVVERPGTAMPLDEMTRRNLELVEPLRGSGRAGTLLDVLDRTMTPMGARLLRQWILAPLVERAAIDARLDAVAALAADALAREALRTALGGVRDVERLAGKAAAGRATPRELAALGTSLGRLPAVAAALERVRAPEGLVHDVLSAWDGCVDVAADVATVLVDRPAAAVGEGDVVRAGVSAELDELRALRDGGKEGIAAIQAAERARTGIASLRVGYNKVFGYFIEVTNAHRELVPADYQRRQTLIGAERYVTPELKAYEERVLTAAERIGECERALFEVLRARVGGAVGRLQRVATALARLDVLAALAEVAEREGYVRPELTEDFALEIVGGRHPVVERMMPRERFIPNDVALSREARLIILTGPNMAGKSTILRQVGLIVLLAQVGSFVPAARARVGVVDRVFTRVGASDHLARGQSTFMVEMVETSAILHAATRRSLVLLDEIGRGTSTYDGVSIAWAVSEQLHEVTGCKVIFATHYHELLQLADELVAVRNYTVAVREADGAVHFLHRLEPGGADRSYGIEVGRLAGLPAPVIARARMLLALLEGGHLVGGRRGSVAAESVGGRTGEPRVAQGAEQLGLFAAAAEHPAVARLRALDVNALTPVEALALLDELVREVGDGA